jgi:hypothetical protein
VFIEGERLGERLGGCVGGGDHLDYVYEGEQYLCKGGNTQRNLPDMEHLLHKNSMNDCINCVPRRSGRIG